MGTTMRVAINYTFAVGLSVMIPALALAQTSKPRTPGQIAAASQHIAERNEGCRQQARTQKLHFLKRHRFMRDCKKANP